MRCRAIKQSYSGQCSLTRRSSTKTRLFLGSWSYCGNLEHLVTCERIWLVSVSLSLFHAAVIDYQIIQQGVSFVNRIAILFMLVGLVLGSVDCGGKPAIGNLQTITLNASPSSNLVGEGGTVQLSAMGVYDTGATKDITRSVVFTTTATGTDDTGVALPSPPNTITVNTTGLVTAVPPFVCSWVDTSSSTTASWYVSGSYQIVATADKIQSQPVFITVASSASNTSPNGQCGP